MFFTRIITIHRALFGQQKVNGVLREHGRDWKKKRWYYDAFGFCLGCLTTAVSLNYFETRCCNRDVKTEEIMKPMREEHAVLRVNKREGSMFWNLFFAGVSVTASIFTLSRDWRYAILGEAYQTEDREKYALDLEKLRENYAAELEKLRHGFMDQSP